ncbi:MAG: PHB depolymerase family esterase [Ilumatobacteraceae bacterium]
MRLRARSSRFVIESAVSIAIVALAVACSSEPDEATPEPTTMTTLTPTTALAPASAPEPATAPAPATTALPSSTVALSAPVEPTGVVTHGTIVVGGVERAYRLYVPSVIEGPVPLFLGLHGGTGWADQFAAVNQVERLAESNAFIVVHPDGVKIGSGPGGAWNGGVCCGAPARDGVDDVGFVNELIDQLEREHEIDPHRIFAFGHSNGAIMSYRLACELADRIVGVGVVAGTLGVEGCAPSQPVSIIHVHGTADENLPITGGVGPKSIAGVDFPVPTEGFETFAAAIGCPAPEVTEQGDVITALSEGCASGSAAEFVTIEGANHAWPGSTPQAPSRAGEPYAAYDATSELVAFLLSHPRP